MAGSGSGPRLPDESEVVELPPPAQLEMRSEESAAIMAALMVSNFLINI